MKSKFLISLLALQAVLSVAPASAKQHKYFSDGPCTFESKIMDRLHNQQKIKPVALKRYREHFEYPYLYTLPERYFDHDEFLQKLIEGNKLYKKKSLKNMKRVLAIGDSWFAYPEEFLFLQSRGWGFGSNTLNNLEILSRNDWHEKGNLPLHILSLSNTGEIVTNMAGIAREDVIDLPEIVQMEVNVFQAIGQCFRRFKEVSKERVERGKSPIKFDYVIISGGGNDLLASPRLHQLFDHKMCSDQSQPVEAIINRTELKKYLARVKRAYEILLDYVEDNSPGTVILAHNYDHFFPTWRGASVVAHLKTVGEGGWFYPVLNTYGISDRNKQREISSYVLTEFNSMLEGLATDPKYQGKFLLVNTQGLTRKLTEHNFPNKPDKWDEKEQCYWLNEIHLVPEGYNTIARAFYNRMREKAGLSTVPVFPRNN